MKLVVNGDDLELEPGATVAALVEHVTERPGGKGTAVAVNGEVVPRGRWGTLALTDGDRVEVLKAVGGG